MSTHLSALYTELVIEHDKRPLHAGLREPFEAEVHHVNPTCGDEITLRLHLSEDGAERIEDVSYDAVGCAMSRASASTSRASRPLTSGTGVRRSYSVVVREKVKPSCPFVVSRPEIV